ncbi:MAG: hypothetical protein IPO60_11760 [Flavobacteriales bacterium]|nr:hypothetical protein [Flavobacteriales bacterium]
MTPHNYPTGNVQFPATWSMAAGVLDRNGYNDLQYGNGSGVSFLMANSTGTDYVVRNFPTICVQPTGQHDRYQQ